VDGSDQDRRQAHTHLGYYDDEDEAARKHDEAATLLGKPLNFPGEGQVEAAKGSKGCTSRYKGSSWHSQRNKWVSRMRIDGKETYLGSFTNEDDAARKYDEAATLLGKHLNFPEEGQVEAVKGSCGGSSRYAGVSWYSQTNKWCAQIKIDGKRTHLGYFVNEDDAVRKYDEAAAPLGRPLNFPGEGQVEAVKGSHGGSSRYSGVNWDNQSNKWKARIKIDGKSTHLGLFEDEDEAARKCDETAAHHDMQRNFPDEMAMSVSRNPAMVAAVIRINGKRTHLGYFESKEKAAQKYDEVASTLKEVGGEELSSRMKKSKATWITRKQVTKAVQTLDFKTTQVTKNPVVLSTLSRRSLVAAAVGTRVRKAFRGFGVYDGIVVDIIYNQAEGELLYRVQYEDGDIEDLTLSEVESLIVDAPSFIPKHALLRNPHTVKGESKRKAAAADFH
jgi:hypothetical protein